MDCSMPAFPVLDYLLEFAQIHVCWVSDAIYPSHPLLSSSPFVFSLFQSTERQKKNLWESVTTGLLLLLLLLLSHFSRVRLCVTHRWQPTRLPRPWDSPGKNTGVGCHFLLQCMKVKVKSLSRVRLLATPWTAAYQAPPSMGFFQARVLEWGAIAFSILETSFINFYKPSTWYRASSMKIINILWYRDTFITISK